mmetsp:Transcript_22693/g.44077  ORF Transcript_22693/g.44077 Transcript_22693/m.44077 type:complete len:164 (-) Transcript_22693:161-652(-)
MASAQGRTAAMAKRPTIPSKTWAPGQVASHRQRGRATALATLAVDPPHEVRMSVATQCSLRAVSAQALQQQLYFWNNLLQSALFGFWTSWAKALKHSSNCACSRCCLCHLACCAYAFGDTIFRCASFQVVRCATATFLADAVVVASRGQDEGCNDCSIILENL